ncbi:hypothetical protein AVEN_206578-1 [Araneus ventricosus]|uniref:Uncharacterized protein n=1 Tax=Araneus ventricosus TaxID=182803 RepID=A0A4Y2VEG8_ARAVE|nr:hypothetical protein AVEN_206578-1 [Araneus ventricosus]
MGGAIYNEIRTGCVRLDIHDHSMPLKFDRFMPKLGRKVGHPTNPCIHHSIWTAEPYICTDWISYVCGCGRPVEFVSKRKIQKAKVRDWSDW